MKNFSLELMIIVVVFIAASIPFSSCRQSAQPSPEVKRSLEFLAENNLKVLVNYNGLFELNVNSGKWIKLISGVQGYKPQDIAIRDNKIYFFDLGDYCIKQSNIYEPRTFKILNKVEQIPTLLSVSHNSERLAYKIPLDAECRTSGVVVLDIEKNAKRQVFSKEVFSIEWSIDDSALFLHTGEYDIIKLDLRDHTEHKIGKGTWMKALPDRSIVYVDWSPNRNACFRKQLPLGSENRLFEVDASLYGMEVDSKGRFIITTNMTSTGLLSHGIVPTIRSIQGEKLFGLPSFHAVTGCIFLLH